MPWWTRVSIAGAGFARRSKCASSFYGLFREAAESAPTCGDCKTCQILANEREALFEVMADLEEGADAIIVKPAGPCGDILRIIRGT